MHCGRATPTDPGVPPRMSATGAFEVAKVTRALAGRYKIDRVIGEGGMATVYLAEDQKHKRKVAVKVMRPELAATLGADRFLREVEIAAQLAHPHILPMHDSGESDGLLYYVMPYVDGESLRERIARDGALPPDEALRLAREVVDALAYAHKHGFIHRDIKPANILLSAGHALVADFGIARAVADESSGESLTRTGLAVGTPQYMAPEQATGERLIDGRADVYAAGAVLYEMLSGEAPFTGANPRAVLTNSLTQTPKPVTTLRPELPPTLNPVVLKALARNPEDRYATADEFVAAIDQLRQAAPTPHTPIPALERPAPPVSAPASPTTSRPAWLSPRNGVIALLVALALFFALRNRGAPTAAPESTGPRGNRLAVLPFAGAGPAVEDYVVNGVAEDIRSKLTGLTALTVIGSESVNEYRNTTKAPADIGRELKADFLLTGTVRVSGDGAARQVVVDPKLLDARSGAVLWQKGVGVAENALSTLPSGVANGVAAALGVKPAPAEQQMLDARPTGSVEAYRSLLRGRLLAASSGSDPATIRGAAQEFEQSVAIDSGSFEAWARLSTANTTLYSNGNHDPQVRARAKEAMDRALAIDSRRSLARRIRAMYLLNVAGDEKAASAEIDLALRESPNDVAMLQLSGVQDANRGDLGSALTKLERARDLDPRAGGMLNSLLQTYTFLGRAKDAEAAGATLVSVRPQDLSAMEQYAIAYLSDGDLKGAREVVRAAIQRGIAVPRIAVQMAGFQEMGWAMEEAHQQLLLRLNPTSFDNDRAWWGQSLATLYWQRGDTVRARAYADSALVPSRQQIAGAPEDPQLHGLLALLLGYLGRAAEARVEEQRSLATVDRYASQAYNLVNAAKTELALGNRDAAVALLAKARVHGYFVTNGMLRIDPTFASLKGYAPFEKMLEAK